MIGKVDGYITENNGNKYLVFTSMELYSTDEKKKILKKYKELWDGIKMRLRPQMAAKQVNMIKILLKLNLNQIVTEE